MDKSEKLMKKFGVVVLHYKTYDDTIKCVDSFLKCSSGVDLEIAVVDNFSKNGSLELLLAYYRNIANVHVLSTTENLGFANGNNFGYYWLKEHYSECDYIICSNNDIYFEDNDFYKKIIKVDEKYGFDLMGPDIYSVNEKIHQNPMNPTQWDIKNINSCIWRLRIKILVFSMLRFFHIRLKNRNSSKVYKDMDYLKAQVDICLHGAFIIFSKNYFHTFNKCFCDKTFLYLEEDILYLLCKKNNLNMVYVPDICVMHNHSSSTRNEHSDFYERKIFTLSEKIKSFKVLREIIKGTYV